MRNYSQLEDQCDLKPWFKSLLSEATLPKLCYFSIDRASELITRPPREFGDLGQIPTQEIQQRTLPVFDNHR